MELQTSSTICWNCNYSIVPGAKAILSFTLRLMIPHNASIELNWGEYGGMKWGMMLCSLKTSRILIVWWAAWLSRIRWIGSLGLMFSFASIRSFFMKRIVAYSLVTFVWQNSALGKHVPMAPYTVTFSPRVLFSTTGIGSSERIQVLFFRIHILKLDSSKYTTGFSLSIKSPISTAKRRN